MRWLEATAARYAMVFNVGTWMPDHVHLVCESPRDGHDLSTGLRFLCSKVAREVNRAFSRTGALFADRFFSRVLETPSELIRALSYVARNPVKAGYCEQAEQWRAGGARDYILGSETPSLWRYFGHFFKMLGFFDDPRRAFLDILSGATRPRRPGPGKQLHLPFKRGLPRLA